MAERTTPIPVRLSTTERARLVALLAHYPELVTLADALRHAITLGTLLMAVQATRPGQPSPYAGYAPDDLAALLAPRLLSALAFLQAQGVVLPGYGTVPHLTPPPAEPALFDATVIADLAAMGTDFLD
jgi:hypothetical protein